MQIVMRIHNGSCTSGSLALQGSNVPDYLAHHLTDVVGMKLYGSVSTLSMLSVYQHIYVY